MNIMRASSEWSSRPDDERYLSLEELHNAVAARRRVSDQAGVALDHCHLVPDEATNRISLVDPEQNKINASFNNWSFSQFCSLIGVNGAQSFLKTLPPTIASIPLQYQMEHGGRADAQVLSTSLGGDEAELRAFTSDTYGRVWDEQVTRQLLDRVDTSVWKVPAASYATTDPKRATTLYASDRDIFLFLVNEEHSLEVPGAQGRDRLHRGFFCWNSEVGKTSVGFATFLYEYVCDNRIVWGASDYQEVRVRHSSGGPHRFIREVVPTVKDYLTSSPADEQQQINNAAVKEVGNDKGDVLEWLYKKGFTKKLGEAAYKQTVEDGGNPRSILGVVQGLTAVVRKDGHTDNRIDVERRAGKLLNLASSSVV